MRLHEPDWQKALSISESGINASAVDKETGRNALQLFIRAACTDQHGVPMDVLEDILTNLQKGGTDLNAPLGGSGETALHIAAALDCPSLVGALLGVGASPAGASQEGSTALHESVRNDSIAIAVALLDAGADLNAEDAAGNTPLHLAASLPDRLEMLELLIERGALPYMRNRAGETPASIARRAGRSPEYIESIERALRTVRRRREVDWVCPGCGAQLERPDARKIDWYNSIGVWEDMTFVCGNCGLASPGVVLDGEG
ncbi:ankyrin repeat domain-containing protein [Candidatus Fermentibacterales bacterium]|nr:ankyrin repeat domain-containing protein [Candidatus Fermentibacterales bacterium]